MLAMHCDGQQQGRNMGERDKMELNVKGMGSTALGRLVWKGDAFLLKWDSASHPAGMAVGEVHSKTAQ